MPNLVFFSIPNSPQAQILGKTQTEVFPISGFMVNPLQKKIIITPELAMILKLESVTKLDKRNKKTSRKFDDNVMSANCDVNVIFSDLWRIWSYPEVVFRMHSL